MSTVKHVFDIERHYETRFLKICPFRISHFGEFLEREIALQDKEQNFVPYADEWDYTPEVFTPSVDTPEDIARGLRVAKYLKGEMWLR